LTEDVPALGLLKHDRLEPCDALGDVGAFESLVVPVDGVVFWRPSAETTTRHRNPLFVQSLGLSPNVAIIVDLLHTLYLGVMKTWARVALWSLLLSGVYGDSGTQAENIRSGVLVLRHSLMSWYSRRHAGNVNEKLTRVADFTVKMVGEPGDQVLKTKGAETWGILLFLLDELRRFEARAGREWRRLLRAGECLEEMVRVWSSHSGVLPSAARRQVSSAYNLHVALMLPFDCYIPKHHAMFHSVLRSGFLGNPKSYDTWHDEALNKLLKASCKYVSQAVFEEAVLVRMRELMRRGIKRDATELSGP
jgi:hypothetical protein